MATRKEMSRRKFVKGAVGVGALLTGGVIAPSGCGQDERPKNVNGILVYPKGDKGPLPEGIKEGLPIVSQFGFKIATIEDKDRKSIQVWVPGTEKDFREAEAKRLGIKPEDVKVSNSCSLVGPNGPCAGYCESGGSSRVAYNGASYYHYYYCYCE
jgi:hypothetical protein